MWRVRADDGSTFGPATLASLQAWARDGRLAPSHTVSSNDKDWIPVTQIRQLEMDWVVEVSPGTFYGPIHQHALEELIRDGSLAPDVLRFTRNPSVARPDTTMQAKHAALAKRLETLQAGFMQRTSELESQVRHLTADGDKLKGQLSTKDLEFDAERQELRAAAARHQAELAKAQAATAVLERQLAQMQHRDDELAAAQTQLAERNAQLAQSEERHQVVEADWNTRLHEAQQALRTAEKALLAERAGQAQRIQDIQRLDETAKAMRLRWESLRKLLQQATTLLADEVSRAETVIEDGVTVVMDEAPPPRTPISLNQLEAQAQREIHRLGQQKGNLFGKRK